MSVIELCMQSPWYLPWAFFTLNITPEQLHSIYQHKGGNYLKKVSTYIKKYIWAYLGAVFCLTIAIALDMLFPEITKRIIDDVIIGGDMSSLSYLLWGFLIIGVGRAILMYIKEFTSDYLGSKISTEMRKDLFHHLQGLSPSFYDKNNTGELMARVKEDIDRIWDGLSFVGILTVEVVIHTSFVLFCMYRLR